MPLPLPEQVEIGPSAMSDDPRIREAVRSALEGKGNPSASPLFEDLYRLIESRGSVLDGSELDRWTDPGRATGTIPDGPAS
ncbi:MAG: hypothetical protein AAGJ83_13350, partial [Planctomycetota bacterium]